VTEFSAVWAYNPWMLIGLVQVAIYVPVATFFCAFLGSYWTRDMAMSVLRQAFALGAKLMMLELLAGASLQFIRNMLDVLKDFTTAGAGAVIAATFILALMVKVLPDWIAQTIGGASIGEGGAVVAVGAAATAGAPSTCRTEVAMAYDESSVLVVTPQRRRR